MGRICQRTSQEFTTLIKPEYKMKLWEKTETGNYKIQDQRSVENYPLPVFQDICAINAPISHCYLHKRNENENPEVITQDRYDHMEHSAVTYIKQIIVNIILCEKQKHHSENRVKELGNILFVSLVSLQKDVEKNEGTKRYEIYLNKFLN